jgi:hypothetical protein
LLELVEKLGKALSINGSSTVPGPVNSNEKYFRQKSWDDPDCK